MKQKKLNGSADLLANAIRQVFEEATENGRAAIKEDLQEVKDDMHEIEKNLSSKIDNLDRKIDTTNKTTNENMQAQFAEQEGKIAKMVSG